jgi:hypothetical protein
MGKSNQYLGDIQKNLKNNENYPTVVHTYQAAVVSYQSASA